MNMVRGITLAENEIVIREYEASALYVPKGEGYVIVTNRRVIFTGNSESVAGTGLIIRDAKIDTITGVMAGLVRHRSFKMLIFGAIIGLLGLIMTMNNSTLISWILLIIGSIMVYFGLKSKGVLMHINIFGAQSSSALSVAVEASTLFSRVTNNQALMTITAAAPGRHTEQMLRELGALIQDVQVMGDMAIEKWKDIPMTEGSILTMPVSEQLSSSINTVIQTANKVKETTVTASRNLQQQMNKTEDKNPSDSLTNQCKCGTAYGINAVFCPECGAKTS
ncbi:hypothetical protein SAMN05428987_4882 [Paenibacillus sp. CF095]|uniref:zinc ribbon domain-containing protein n=1 Tax=Paenibacillus sp. CF095 TaxID=1881033 RepID=UPI00088A020C|nr:zinc ribbon domain-containing protein [Paenibacillus sp. CF095]SDD47461.1 hypothetical protein SAMN05428987_4882 [Paenibacillus sp. CF095]